MSFILSCQPEISLQDVGLESDRFGNSITGNYAVSPGESGDIHTRITEFCYDKIIEWRRDGLSNRQIRDKVYDEVFIKEMSRLTGISRTTISSNLKNVMGLYKSNMDSWSIYDFTIGHYLYNALYNDIQNLVNQNYSIRGWSFRLGLIRDEYADKIPKDHLDMIIDVSHSSYTYWYSNYDDWIAIPNSTIPVRTFEQVYNPNRPGNGLAEQRHDQACAKEKVVGGDVKGAIWGVISSSWSGLGAIGGGVFGAMGGTLLGAIDAAFRC